MFVSTGFHGSFLAQFRALPFRLSCRDPISHSFVPYVIHLGECPNPICSWTWDVDYCSWTAKFNELKGAQLPPKKKTMNVARASVKRFCCQKPLQTQATSQAPPPPTPSARRLVELPPQRRRVVRAHRGLLQRPGPVAVFGALVGRCRKPPISTIPSMDCQPSSHPAALARTSQDSSSVRNHMARASYIGHSILLQRNMVKNVVSPQSSPMVRKKLDRFWRLTSKRTKSPKRLEA